MIGSKKTKEEPKLSFADRLGKVKSMFVSAYNEADSLSKEKSLSNGSIQFQTAP